MIPNPATPAELRRWARAGATDPEFVEGLQSEVLRLFAADHAALARLLPAIRTLAQSSPYRSAAFRMLGIAERTRGRWTESARAFVEAGRSASDAVDQLALQTGAVDGLARAGRFAEAIELGRRLRDGLEAAGRFDLAARVRMNLAHAFINRDDYAAAIEELEGVPERLEVAGLTTESASARMARSSAHLFGGSLEIARREAARAQSAARDAELEYLADLATVNLAHIDLLVGDADRAVFAFIDLREKFRDVPVDLARVNEFLGDGYMALNLWEEALESYRDAAPAAIPLHRAHLALGEGRALLKLGRRAESVAKLAQAARRYARLGDDLWLAMAHVALHEAGRRRSLELAEAAARRSGSPYAIAVVATNLAEIGAMAPKDALASVLRHGYGGLAWRIHLATARRTGRLSDFRKAFRAAIADQVRLGSPAARAAALRDKADGLREYIARLAERPTPSRLAEALDAITQTRNVGLLDDLGTFVSDPEVQAEIERLRRESTWEAGPFSSARRVDALRNDGTGEGHRLNRRFFELASRTAKRRGDRAFADDSMAFVVRPDRVLALSHRGVEARRLEVDRLARSLDWLHYELAAPQTLPDAPAEPVLDAVEDLVSRLGAPCGGVVPDGPLWRIPWGLVAEVSDVRMHPSFGLPTEPLPLRRTAIWVGRSEGLPFAHEEVAAFRRLFPDACVIASAREARTWMESGEVDVLHVMAHAVHRDANPALSAIEFPDGPIYAAEIARSGLRCGFACLAACETGSVSGMPDEPDGLVRAFLSRRARAVVAAQWQLDDRAARIFSDVMYRELTSGNRIALAVGSARATVREQLPHPYYWGANVLYGGFDHEI